MYTDEYTESVKNMRKRTVRLDREGDYWTSDEKEILRQKFFQGEGITMMAINLQRTESAIIQQIELMDLFERKKKNTAPKEPRCLCTNCKVDPASCPFKDQCPRYQGNN